MDTEPTGLTLGAAYFVAAVTAISLGICAGSIASSRVHEGRQHLMTVEASNKARASDPNDPDADLSFPLNFVPTGLIKIDGNCFAVLAEQIAGVQKNGAGRGGSAEIFDRSGRLRRRYIAAEQTDSSWQLTEYVRLPAHFARRLQSCQ